MSTENKRIGQIIRDTRIERGITQQDLAKKLNTSQSAINRIEKGNQNISIDMVSKISKVLDREIISISSSDKMSFQIKGGKKLQGSIEVRSSKNVTMGLLFASLLNKNVTIIENAPKIEEVNRILEYFASLGVQCRWVNKDKDLEIKPPKKINLEGMDKKAATRTRSVIMSMGPFLHMFKEFKIPFAGGCKLGERTVRPHLFALEEFGLRVKTTAGLYTCTTIRKDPDEVVMYEQGDTATENALLAAALSPGKTVIKFASANYIPIGVCLYLKKAGLKVEGIGTSTITVYGKSSINKRIRISPMEDPIEAMALLSVAAVTNSIITIKGCAIEYLQAELQRMKLMGYRLKLSKRYKSKDGFTDLVDIKTYKYIKLTALEDKIEAHPYPGINMDNLPFMVLFGCLAKGETLIHDWVYENRAIYYTELVKLGANVKLADPHRAYVYGPTKFKPNDMMAPVALRPAVILLIAMLAAPGKSILRDVYVINRGYEDLAERLNALGADIKVLHNV